MKQNNNSEQIPVFLLTGFLGAGKTTLLNRIMEDPAFHDTALIINEFGEVPVDHHLVHEGSERTMVSTTGCICCARGSDMRSSLDQLLTGRKNNSLPPYSRVIVETTGLAFPAPIINSLLPGGMEAKALRDHAVARAFHLSSVITVVDAESIEATLEQHPESLRQIAFADHLVLTRTENASYDLSDKLHAINPSAKIHNAIADDFNPDILLVPGSYSAFGKGEQVSNWLADETKSDLDLRRHENITAVPLTREGLMSKKKLQEFLATLTSTPSNGLLRIKGLIALQESPENPTLVHVVGHRLFPLKRMESWPDEIARTRLMVIGTNINQAEVETNFMS